MVCLFNGENDKFQNLPTLSFFNYLKKKNKLRSTLKAMKENNYKYNLTLLNLSFYYNVLQIKAFE